MSRITSLLLLAGVVGLAAADDPAPPLPKLPKFKDYTALPDVVRGKVKSAKGDTVTVVVPELSIGRSSGRSKRPPTVKEKDVEHTLTLHPDALVRWSKRPDHTDDKGKPKPYTSAELKLLMTPVGAPGILGDKTELTAGQTVEITLLVPNKVKPDEFTEQDYRIKWVVIQGTPPDPKDVVQKEAKKK